MGGAGFARNPTIGFVARGGGDITGTHAEAADIRSVVPGGDRKIGGCVTGWQVVSVVIAFPAGLAALLLITARLEARLLAPDERAEKLHGALQAAAEPNEVEELATRLARQAMPVAGMRAHQGRWLHPAGHLRTPRASRGAVSGRPPRLDTSERMA